MGSNFTFTFTCCQTKKLFFSELYQLGEFVFWQRYLKACWRRSVWVVVICRCPAVKLLLLVLLWNIFYFFDIKRSRKEAYSLIRGSRLFVSWNITLKLLFNDHDPSAKELRSGVTWLDSVAKWNVFQLLSWVCRRWSSARKVSMCLYSWWTNWFSYCSLKFGSFEEAVGFNRNAKSRAQSGTSVPWFPGTWRFHPLSCRKTLGSRTCS